MRMGGEVWLHAFCSALDGSVWSASFPSRFSSGATILENTLKERELVYSKFYCLRLWIKVQRVTCLKTAIFRIYYISILFFGPCIFNNENKK